MRWSAFVRRVRALVAREAVEREMSEELQLHFEMQVRHFERQGMSPDAARRAAAQAFGGVEVVKEAYRDARGVRPLEDVVQDVRFAVRSLRRRPLFTAVTTLTIALGVGVATSIYSVVDGVLLRPLPFREPARLVQVWRTYPEWRKEPILAARWDRIRLSIPEYRDLQAKATAFQSIAVWVQVRETLVEGERWERVPTIRASSGMLDVLEVRPFRGRTFLPEEDRPGAAGVAMISYEAWQTRYGGDASILGRTIRFEDRAYSVVGVLPPRLKIGRTEESELGLPVFWIPVGQSSGSDYADRASRTYYSVARLAPGVTVQRAEAEARAILRDPENPSRVGARLVEWQRDQTREARGPLLLLLAGVGLLLLIACVNVATILLGEATSRDQEMAARIALGAGRGRIVRQLLTESVTLAALGGALGIAAAWMGTRALVALAPADTPGIGDVAVDGRVIAVAVLTLTASGIAFGLVPALTLSRAGPAALLKVGAGQSLRGRSAMQRALVAGELALSVVLLTAAGLLARSFHNITSVDPGFRPDNLVYVNSILPRAVLGDSDAVHRIYDAGAVRLAALGGVVGVAVVTDPPFIGGVGITSFTIEGETSDPASRGTLGPGGTRRHRAQDRAVSPGFFRLLGVPVIAGREFTTMDRTGAAGVAVVSAALARRDFLTGSPIGRRVWQRGQWRTIVGVVGDVLEAKLTGAAEPAFYTPITQRVDVLSPSLIVKWSGTMPSVAMLQDALRQADSRLVVTGVHSSRDLIERSFAGDRFRTMLMSVFGILAALLSTVGMYGVTARAVARRTREVGIRLALGATTSAVVGNLMRGTLAGAAAGVIAGLGIAFLAARLLSPFLFGITPADPGTYVGIVALLALTAALASWLPARGAGRLDVARVLRTE